MAKWGFCPWASLQDQLWNVPPWLTIANNIFPIMLSPDLDQKRDQYKAGGGGGQGCWVLGVAKQSSVIKQPMHSSLIPGALSICPCKLPNLQK